MKAEIVHEAVIDTPNGPFLAQYSSAGLCKLWFPQDNARRVRAAEQKPVPANVRNWERLTTQALLQMLAGKEPAALPPLDFSSGTDFQQSVWRQMLAIPWGQTRSYSDLAKSIGKPKATRAVGSACGANRIPVLIPCHRVLAKGDRLGGFSGGLDWKRTLLSREGHEHFSLRS